MEYAISYLNIQNLRTWFRRWYGLLSIEELAANRDLADKIQELENLFLELSCGQ
jgi:hypothetical protein